MTTGLALLLAANLVALGDFETERPARDYGFHTYGAGRGSSGRAQAGEKGGWCARLAMERGPGGAKMGLPVPLADVEALKVTFRYRVTAGGLGAVTVRFGNGAGRSFVPAKLPNGKDASVKTELHPTDGWQTFSRAYSVPAECRGAEGRAALIYVIWGKQEPVELLVDDVANIVGWLLRDPATEAHRKELRNDLFLTQEAFSGGTGGK